MRTVQQQRSDVEQYLDSGFLDLDGLLDALELVVEPSSSLFGKPGLRLRKCPADRRKVAIAISGGGAAGAYNAGLLEVLLARMRQRGIEPDLLVGTSSGALNGYGVFLESLGMGNPQFDSEASVRQPYESYIASVWSYMARDGKASRWVVGRRSWIVGLVSRGARRGWSIAGLILAAIGALLLFQPNLLLPLAALVAEPGPDGLTGALPFLFGYALVATLVLSLVLWLVLRRFGQSLFLDLPLLGFLANTGPNGDLRRRPSGPKGQAVDQAKVLSRNIVRRWYDRGGHAPEFIITGTDISAGRECLFTLVHPETYDLLRRAEWMAVQFDSDSGAASEYRGQTEALFTRSERLLQALVASSAVPGAFPTQRIGIYEGGSSSVAHHHFVDGGVMNNSPVHIAIDAGATHVISLEILPHDSSNELRPDQRGRGRYLLLEAALATLTTVLERAIKEDVRRTASWNRFLVSRPKSLDNGRAEATENQRSRRIVPLYRIAPTEPLVGTVEFDGRFEAGQRTVTLRDLLHRGVLDMQGRNVWTATLRHEPGWRDPDSEVAESLYQASA